jgi:succinyl-CoA synthetase beta subunit/citryl-CoA synthetase large subunit
MKVLEYEAKKLLAAEGLAAPPGEVVTDTDQAGAFARSLGRPVALKVQIPAGRRMKAGGVRFAGQPEEAAASARDLLGSTIHGFGVERILVEEKLAIAAEILVSMTYDTAAATAMVVALAEGGIEVEAATGVVRRPFPLALPVPDYLGREVAAELGFTGARVMDLGRHITCLARCFHQWDALLLEINPLALDTQGRWWIADAHLELDDDAAYRQQELWSQLSASVEMANRRTAFEQQAAEIDSADHRGVAGRLVPFDGNLGLLMGGGGAGLTIMDALLDAGLEPANYCEIGGNPSVWKIKELTKLILRQPQVERLAVIMNVVNNTRADLVARGVIKGVLEMEREPREVIIAFRIPGSWQEEGRSIMQRYGVPFFDGATSIDQVIEAIRWPS